MRPSGVFQEGPGLLSKLERAQACMWAAGSELMRLLLLRGVSNPSMYQLPANGYETIHHRLGEGYKHMESFIWLSFELEKKIKLCNLPKTRVGYSVIFWMPVLESGAEEGSVCWVLLGTGRRHSQMKLQLVFAPRGDSDMVNPLLRYPITFCSAQEARK